MKNLKWPFKMSCLGIFIGLFIFSIVGNDYYMNKSEKKVHRSMTNSLAFPICLICGLIGMSIGLYINRQEENTIKYGFDNADTYEQKVGRGWVYYTRWKNPLSDVENVIHTEKSNNDYLKTYLNDQIFLSHDVNTAAKKVVYECHLQARNDIWKKIMSDELSQL